MWKSLIVVAVVVGSAGACGEPPEPLNASVEFTGTQFVVKNLASGDWTDVRVEVNHPDGYSYRIGALSQQQAQTVGALLLAKDDGTRFNPLQVKPQNVWVRANVMGSSKLYIGHFND
jgi:hypothetical protein